MIAALNKRGLGKKTLVIVSAKHGQSPIDVTKRKALDDGAVIAAPIGSNFAFDIADDGVLIWLKPPYSAANVAAAVAALNAFQGDTGIVEWLAGPLLSLPFQDPATDSRTPDIIGIARVGVIYTGGSKIAEHGGFNEDDTHVALIVANAGLEAIRRHSRGVDDADSADHSAGARSRSAGTRCGPNGRDDCPSRALAITAAPATERTRASAVKPAALAPTTGRSALDDTTRIALVTPRAGLCDDHKATADGT